MCLNHSLGRFPLVRSTGHMQLFFDIINSNTANTYKNLDDCSEALYIFIRRHRNIMSTQKKQNMEKSDLPISSLSDTE